MKKIMLKPFGIALVDDDDWERLSVVKWVRHRQGYATRNSVKVLQGYMHRQIMGAKPGEFVDHINGDKLDNRKENLRIATRAQNSANRPALRNNTSGFKGVTKDRRCVNRWYAQINHGGRVHYLGYFSNPVEAAVAYNTAALAAFGKYASINKVDL